MLFGFLDSPSIGRSKGFRRRGHAAAGESREIAVGGRSYAVRITRRRNTRRLTMRVRDRIIRVSAPKSAGLAEIEQFITANIGWIDTQLAAEHIAIPIPVPALNGSGSGRAGETPANDSAPVIYYRGAATPIRVIRDPRHRGRSRITPPGDGEMPDDALTLRLPAASRRIRPHRVLEDWLREKARRVLTDEMAIILHRLGEMPDVALTIRDQRTRWGSCSTTRRISLNWRLIMAPPKSLEYVVLHEAAHLIHHDHSKRFWGLVRDHMPDYEIHQRWLDTHQAALFADMAYLLRGLDDGIGNNDGLARNGQDMPPHA